MRCRIRHTVHSAQPITRSREAGSDERRPAMRGRPSPWSASMSRYASNGRAAQLGQLPVPALSSTIRCSLVRPSHLGGVAGRHALEPAASAARRPAASARPRGIGDLWPADRVLPRGADELALDAVEIDPNGLELRQRAKHLIRSRTTTARDNIGRRGGSALTESVMSRTGCHVNDPLRRADRRPEVRVSRPANNSAQQNSAEPRDRWQAGRHGGRSAAGGGLVDQRDDPGEHVRVGLRQHAVAEVEHVARAPRRPRRSTRRTSVSMTGHGREQHARVEVALQRVARADPPRWPRPAACASPPRPPSPRPRPSPAAAHPYRLQSGSSAGPGTPTPARTGPQWSAAPR